MIALITELRNRGFILRVVAGSLRIAPASALKPRDRDAIRTDLPALIAALSPGNPWNQREALRWMYDADTLVERLGVDGQHPEVAAAAAMVGSAYASCDMETVQFACSEFGVVVRAVAARERREKLRDRD